MTVDDSIVDQNEAIRKGLVGVITDSTAISKVMPESNSLTYRGYPVQMLAEQCRFEEVAYLLLFGELPDETQLAAFNKRERAGRAVMPAVIDAIKTFPKHAHPMARLRTAVSLLGLYDDGQDLHDPTRNIERSIMLYARIATLVAADMRIRNGQEPITPDPELDFAENFLYMCFGKVPEAEIVKCLDISLTLYAEHGFNASTFTARTIISSLSGMYSSITGAIGSLKGTLHGGANEAVMHMLMEVDDPKQAEAWIHKALKEKRLIMGFGHRVYYKGDSRVPAMTRAMHDVARITGGEKWVEMSDVIQTVMIEEKGIYPNLDFPTGPAYYMMGFDIPTFTPIFVVSRIVGWCAHIMEQLSDNKLIRPLSAYKGPQERIITPMDRR